MSCIHDKAWLSAPYTANRTWSVPGRKETHMSNSKPTNEHCHVKCQWWEIHVYENIRPSLLKGKTTPCLSSVSHLIGHFSLLIQTRRVPVWKINKFIWWFSWNGVQYVGTHFEGYVWIRTFKDILKVPFWWHHPYRDSVKRDFSEIIKNLQRHLRVCVVLEVIQALSSVNLGAIR